MSTWKQKLGLHLDANLAFIWNDLLNDRARRLAAESMTLAVLGSLLLIAAPYGISIFVDGLTTKQMGPLALGAIVFVAIQLIEIGIGYVRQQHREYFFQEAFWYVPQAITRLAFARPLAWLAGGNSDIDGGGIESLRDKTWNVINNYIFAIIPVYSQTVFGLGACFVAHPIIGLLALGYAVVELALGRFNNRFIHSNMKPVIDQFKRADRRRSEWWHALDHIKNHGVETKVLDYIHSEVQEALKGDDAVWRVYFAKWRAIRGSLSLLFAIPVYGVMAYFVLVTESISTAFGVLVFFSFQRVRNTLYELSDQQREVQFNLVSIAKYRRTLKKPVPFSYNHGTSFNADNTKPSIDLTFDTVSHSVEEDNERKCILRDVNLTVAAGEKIGIVGPSGAGKSQLLSLLVRATDPTAGQVLVNGVDLRTWRPESLLRYYGVIMQKSAPFEDTVLGNLLFSVSHLDLPVPYQELSATELAKLEEKAEQALRRAGLDTSTFPQGLYTSIGYKGLKLSGGQQQRLQIASAHMKLSMTAKRPRLILADEPTASLDSLSELTVMEHLKEQLPSGTTMLIVAHRLSTVANMDRIVFVRPLSECSDGVTQVTAHTSMAELYNTEALFREMADAQGFRP